MGEERNETLEWVIVESAPLYEINRSGDIRNLSTKHVLKVRADKQGYIALTVMLRKNHRVTRFLHRILAQAFIPNPENKPQVNHKDLNKANNKIENLEWVTASENQLHSVNTTGGRGLSTEKILTILTFIDAGLTKTETARLMGLHRKTVARVLRKVWDQNQSFNTKSHAV